MNAREHAAAYLEARHLLIDDIARRAPEVRPGETLIFGGSIPEGLASAESDIDLTLIGAARTPRGYRVVEGHGELVFDAAFAPPRIHVESVPLGHMEALAGQMDEMRQALSDPDCPRRLYAFPPGDLRIMHRVRTGLPLRNPDVTEHWRARLHSEFLPTYVLVLTIVRHFTIREDAIAEARERHHDSSVWMMKQALSLAAHALLAAAGESHPSEKWLLRRLRRHEPDFGSTIVDSLIGYLTGRNAPGELEPYLRDAIELADRAIEVAMLRRPEVLAVLMKIRDEQPSLTTHLQSR
jgi:HEPN domain-containing protein